MIERVWMIVAAAVLGLAVSSAWADPPTPAAPPAEAEAEPPASAPAEQPASEPAEQPAAERAQPSRRGETAGSPPQETISEDQERELLEAIRQRYPQRYEQLNELRRSNPGRYRQTIASWYRRYRQWQTEGTVIEDLEMSRQELEIESVRLVQLWRQTTDESKKRQLEIELRQVLARKFDKEQEIHARQLERMSQQIQQLNQEHGQRAQQRAEMVGRELDSLLHGDSPPSSGPPADDAAPAPDDRPAPANTHPPAGGGREPSPVGPTESPGNDPEDRS